MLRAIIVEDETHCSDRLMQLLAAHAADEVHVMEIASTIGEATTLIKKLRPDLVFLDVQLGEHTSFELLKDLSEIFFKIIFTTAYDQYAVQAFRYSAIDYLLKPVDAEELMHALEKVTSFEQGNTHHYAQIKTLLHNVDPANQPQKKLAVPIVNGLIFVDISQIVRLESDGNYTTIYTIDKQKLLVAKTLKVFEELLLDQPFCRVHNSHLINLNYIKSYKKGKSGFLTMQDGSSVEVSSRRKEEFMKRIGQA
jgi:two-component system, LytTR family, response regulator